MYDPMSYARHDPARDRNYTRAMLLLVDNVNEIERIPVMPGERIWAMSTNDAVIGCRTGGDMGASTTYCKLEPYELPAPDEYVTKRDLEDMLSRILAAQQPAATPNADFAAPVIVKGVADA